MPSALFLEHSIHTHHLETHSYNLQKYFANTPEEKNSSITDFKYTNLGLLTQRREAKKMQLIWVVTVQVVDHHKDGSWNSRKRN